MLRLARLACWCSLFLLLPLHAQEPPCIAAGEIFTLVRKANGEVLAFGDNYFGQLGLGDNVQRLVPTMVPALQGARMVAAGYDHALALMPDGTVRSWGSNYFGQLGYGTGMPAANVNTPTTVPGLAGIVSIHCGRQYSLALAVNGGTTAVWGWGYNSGILGLGTSAAVGTPTEITALQGSSPVVAIDGGRFTSYFLKADGTVWASGNNMFGQLGRGNTTLSTGPVQTLIPATIIGIAAGDFHAFAVDSTGHAWCWGQGGNSALGLGTTTNVLTPVLHPFLSGVRSIAAGQVHTLALLQGGAVMCMGGGGSGQLGTGSTTASPTPVNVPAISTCQSVFAGVEQSFVIQVNGTVKAFGKNVDGRLGTGTTSAAVTLPATIQQLCNLGNPVSLALAPFGSGGLMMTLSCNWTTVLSAAPLAYFNVFTVNPPNPMNPGTVWWYGLYIDGAELMSWVDIASTGLPICFGTMSPWGAAANYPLPLASLAGLTVHGVSVLVDPLTWGGVVASSGVMSTTF